MVMSVKRLDILVLVERVPQLDGKIRRASDLIEQGSVQMKDERPVSTRSRRE